MLRRLRPTLATQATPDHCQAAVRCDPSPPVKMQHPRQHPRALQRTMRHDSVLRTQAPIKTSNADGKRFMGRAMFRYPRNAPAATCRCANRMRKQCDNNIQVCDAHVTCTKTHDITSALGCVSERLQHLLDCWRLAICTDWGCQTKGKLWRRECSSGGLAQWFDAAFA